MTQIKRKSKYLHKQAEWAELYNQGMSFRQIGEKEGLAYTTVQNVLKDVIIPRSKQPFNQLAEEWVTLYEEGWSTHEIGAKYQVSGTTVHRYLKNKGVTFRRQKSFRHKKFDHVKAEWIEQYRQGKSLKEIADHYGTIPQTVHVYIKEEIEMREYSETSRTHTVNDFYFDEINTSDKAYWLGFLFSSGCIIRKVGNFAVQASVAEKDLDRIDRFKEVLESDTPYNIQRRQNTSYYQLRFNSKHMFESLKKLGLKRYKQEHLAFPESLSPNFHSAFILGYYEGKGCCYNTIKKNRPTPKITFILYGTERILKSIQEIIQKECQVSLKLNNRTYPNNRKSYFVLESWNRGDIQILADWLYQNQTEYSTGRDIREIVQVRKRE